MPIVVALLLLVAIFLFARASKDGAKEPAMSAEERELRRLPDESVRLLAYYDNPTPAMKAEYVRRHGEWPGYTAESFAEDARLAKKFEETAAQLKTRYEQNPKGEWVLKEGARPFVPREEPPAEPQALDLAAFSEEKIDMIPYLHEPSEEEKAEYVRRRGSWPGRLEMDPELERKFHLLAAAMKEFGPETALCQKFHDDALNAVRERADSLRGVRETAQPPAEKASPQSGEDFPGFRPAR